MAYSDGGERADFYDDVVKRKVKAATPKAGAVALRDAGGYLSPAPEVRAVCPDARWPHPPLDSLHSRKRLDRLWPRLMQTLARKSPTLGRRLRCVEVERYSGIYLYLYTTCPEDHAWFHAPPKHENEPGRLEWLRDQCREATGYFDLEIEMAGPPPPNTWLATVCEELGGVVVRTEAPGSHTWDREE